MLCSSYHHKPSRISHPCRIDIHIVLHYSSLTSTSPWFFSLLCHKCLEVNHPSFSLQFRWWLLNTVIVWLLEKYYWFCVTFSVFCFFFLLFPLSTNCFSVVPLQLKMQSTLVLVTLPMKKLCLYLSLSLFSVYYYCCCIIPSRIAGKTSVFRCNPLLYLKWSLGTNPPVFLLDYYNHLLSTILVVSQTY